jgi:hypothetical protein
MGAIARPGNSSSGPGSGASGGPILPGCDRTAGGHPGHPLAGGGYAGHPEHESGPMRPIPGIPGGRGYLHPSRGVAALVARPVPL